MDDPRAHFGRMVCKELSSEMKNASLGCPGLAWRVQCVDGVIVLILLPQYRLSAASMENRRPSTADIRCSKCLTSMSDTSV